MAIWVMCRDVCERPAARRIFAGALDYKSSCQASENREFALYRLRKTEKSGVASFAKILALEIVIAALRAI